MKNNTNMTYTNLAIHFLGKRHPEHKDELFFEWSANPIHHEAVNDGFEKMTTIKKAAYVDQLEKFATEYLQRSIKNV